MNNQPKKQSYRMNLYGKVTLFACGVAVLSSVATVAALRMADDTVPMAADIRLAESTTDSGSDFLNVIQRPVENTDFTNAAESTINGVVSIKSYATPRSRYSNQQGGGGDFFMDPFEFFFGQPSQPRRQQQPRNQQPDESQQQQLGLGSGVIVSADGYIITNNHVIDGAERLEVTLNDNRQFNATVIGTDPTTDLALVKIDATDLPVIPIGDSDNLRVGEWVLAVGNPFGFTSTVTAGIVSAKARSISSVAHTRQMGIESYIQTDAAVNPGNSGGALVNLHGELVGINTAIYSQTGSYAGYSFAIPTSIVAKVMTDIKQYGAVQRAILGIVFRELTPALAKEKNITEVNEGVYVEEVVDRGSAKEAGILPGDVIVEINGVTIRNGAQMQEQIAKYRPGDKISVGYVRDGKQKKTNVTLLNNQGSTKITAAATLADLGCAFKKPSAETLQQLKISSGLQVTGLKDGKFKDAGIKDGFIILDINNARVASADDVENLYKEIMKSEEYDKVMFITGIYPTGRKMYYAVDLAE
ncbi:MAG: Do family serine endopeptidase [Clostridium sp.]|nr:Do family serine endopeptidase [Clostridium sp.]